MAQILLCRVDVNSSGRYHTIAMPCLSVIKAGYSNKRPAERGGNFFRSSASAFEFRPDCLLFKKSQYQSMSHSVFTGK